MDRPRHPRVIIGPLKRREDRRVRHQAMWAQWLKDIDEAIREG